MTGGRTGHEELEACFLGPRNRNISAFFTPGFLSRSEIESILALARSGGLHFSTGPDSVDEQPTFEVYALDAGKVLHPALCEHLLPVVRSRLEPWARARYGCPNASVCTILLRRYLLTERREHPPHFDAHAYATCVVGLNPADFIGGLYVQPTPMSRREFVILDPGDAVMHQYDLRHGVEVERGERYSLIFWLKDSMESCLAGITPWYDVAAASGDADAAYNLGNLLMVEGRQEDARRWYTVAAAIGQPDAAQNLGVMMYRGVGGPVDTAGAFSCWMAAARNGKAMAARHLGVALLGLGIVSGEDGCAHSSKETVCGLRWLALAAQRGDGGAMLMLHHWATSASWRPSEVLRRRLRNTAAARGNAEAQFLRGEEHLNSFLDMCASPSRAGSAACLTAWRTAMLWLRRAANNGNTHAMLLLADAAIHPSAPAGDIGPAASWTWLRKALGTATDGSELAILAASRHKVHYLQGPVVPHCLGRPAFSNACSNASDEEALLLSCDPLEPILNVWMHTPPARKSTCCKRAFVCLRLYSI